MTLIAIANTQTLELQDLSKNNGYVPIKTGEFRLIEHYNKILHIVNVTEYEQTLELITDNIRKLKGTTKETEPLLNSIIKNFALLKAKIDNLNPHFRTRRGLVNIMGKGLKIIAGTMDSDDEKQITNKLNILYNKGENLTNELDNLTQISSFMTLQIKNITEHINQQQDQIGKYLNRFKNILQNKISTLEDELNFMSQVYQINNDISILKDHIDNIGQIIFSSKLGIIPTDILTKMELDFITDFESYTNIKVTVAFHENNIIIILKIPKYSELAFSKIHFEPIPNGVNKSIMLDTYEILVDTDNKIYKTDVKDNMLNNIISLNNKCLQDIINFEEAECPMNLLDGPKTVEILQGILIFKNFNSNITHNCNERKITENGNFMIKFENCEIKTLNRTYTNVNIKLHDKFVLPNVITKVMENSNTTLADIKLESLYLKQIQYDENINKFMYNNSKTKTISLSIDIIIIICILILAIVYLLKPRQKYVISSEPHSNGGGVTTSKIEII